MKVFVILFFLIAGCGTATQPPTETPITVDTYVYTTVNKGVVETYITSVSDTVATYFLQDASPTRILLEIKRSRLRATGGEIATVPVVDTLDQ